MLAQLAGIQSIYRCRMELVTFMRIKHIQQSQNHLMDGVN
jgi:hypothetical protein